jgi:hypothetical protein
MTLEPRGFDGVRCEYSVCARKLNGLLCVRQGCLLSVRLWDCISGASVLIETQKEKT